MQNWVIRLLIVFAAILGILLIVAAVFLHHMYPMRATDKESVEERRWIHEEESRRKTELVRDEIGLLAAAGLDVAAMILLFSYDRRRRLS